MKRWQIEDLASGRLELAEVAMPSPGPGEALLRVKAVALNYRDNLFIEGRGYVGVGLPFTPGSDMVAEVVAVGPGVTRVKAGTRVLGSFTAGWLDGPPPRRDGSIDILGGSLPGVLSEYLTMRAEWLVAAPQSLTDVQASTLPCAALTAWSALFELGGGIRPGDWVVTQGTGGVSLFALQLARAAGARVAVLSRSADKLERAKAMGASLLIDTRATPDWDGIVLDATGGRGAEHIIELIGGDNLARSVKAVAPAGRVSMIGVYDGFAPTLPLFPTFQGQVTIQGILIGHRRALEDLVRAIDRIGIEPVVDAEFAFADLPKALDRLAAGPFGKVVVRVV